MIFIRRPFQLYWDTFIDLTLSMIKRELGKN